MYERYMSVSFLNNIKLIVHNRQLIEVLMDNGMLGMVYGLIMGIFEALLT